MSRLPAFKKAKEMLNEIRTENWKTLGQLIKTDMPKKIMELDRMWKSWATTKDRILNCEIDEKVLPSCSVVSNKRAKHCAVNEPTKSCTIDSVDIPLSKEVTKGSGFSQSSESEDFCSSGLKECLQNATSNSSKKSESSTTEMVAECSSQHSRVSEEPEIQEGGKKRKLSQMEKEDGIQDEEFPLEDKIKELNKTLRLEINDIVTHLDRLRMCICLTRPKLQDGHNFGVKVQLQVRRILQGGISASITYLDTISNNHMLSAKMREKIQKYPNIEDYRLALKEQRSKVLLNQIYCLRALRDTYTVCHDTVVKNLERLKVPRPGGDAWMVSY